MAKPTLVIGDEGAPHRRPFVAPDLTKQRREFAVQTAQSGLFRASNPTHLIVEPADPRQEKRIAGPQRQKLKQPPDRRHPIGLVLFVDRKSTRLNSSH